MGVYPSKGDHLSDSHFLMSESSISGNCHFPTKAKFFRLSILSDRVAPSTETAFGRGTVLTGCLDLLNKREGDPSFLKKFFLDRCDSLQVGLIIISSTVACQPVREESFSRASSTWMTACTSALVADESDSSTILMYDMTQPDQRHALWDQPPQHQYERNPTRNLQSRIPKKSNA